MRNPGLILVLGLVCMLTVGARPLEPQGYRMDDYRTPTPQTVAGGVVLGTELETYFRDHLDAATRGHRDTAIVFYCLVDCWMSWNAAKRAASWGYTRVYWYPDGTDGWEAAKLPLAETEPVPGP